MSNNFYLVKDEKYTWKKICEGLCSILLQFQLTLLACLSSDVQSSFSAHMLLHLQVLLKYTSFAPVPLSVSYWFTVSVSLFIVTYASYPIPTQYFMGNMWIRGWRNGIQCYKDITERWTVRKSRRKGQLLLKIYLPVLYNRHIHILALFWLDITGLLCALKTTHGYNQWLKMGTENQHVL